MRSARTDHCRTDSEFVSTAVAEAVRRAVANPEHGASRSGSTRRLLVKGFPFTVIYRASDREGADRRHRRFKTAARVLGRAFAVI